MILNLTVDRSFFTHFSSWALIYKGVLRHPTTMIMVGSLQLPDLG